MKKFLTLTLLLAAAIMVQAQGFVFQYQGVVLPDGETVTIPAEEDFFGDLSCVTNDVLNPADGLVLLKLSGMPLTASATLQITHNSLEADVMQWCMGGECTPLNGQTVLTKRFALTGSEQVQFDAMGIHTEGYLRATLKVTVGLETHQVNIIFVNGDIDAISSPRASQEGRLSVTDLHGRPVSGRPSAGIYLVTEGTRTRKIAVR